jgi:hypothetical protein
MKRSSPVTPSDSGKTPFPGTADVAVVLPARCTINEIGALQDCLRAAASVAASLDGTAVQRIDAAGLKLLMQYKYVVADSCRRGFPGAILRDRTGQSCGHADG